MKGILIVFFFHVAIFCNADMVCLRLTVMDYDGDPIEGAHVKCVIAKKRAAPYAPTEYKEVRGITDCNGSSDLRFLCWDGRVNCLVDADGYYVEKLPVIKFKTDYDLQNKKTIYHEVEKAMCVRLRRIVNPQPMIRHRIVRGNVSMPNNDGVFGYDLELGDWIRPYGKGRVADFSVEYTWKEVDGVIDCQGAIVFSAKGEGAYVARKTSCERMSVDYNADTNATYQVRLPFVCKRNSSTGFSDYKDILTAKEYLVIRSRVEVDENGNVVKAHYSQIHGPFTIGRYMELKDSYFNPKVNETNLEYTQNIRYAN